MYRWILSIYPLICGHTCNAWMVDTQKCTTEQNYLYLCGHLAVTSRDAMVAMMNWVCDGLSLSQGGINNPKK